jgi:hypothetical protein
MPRSSGRGVGALLGLGALALFASRPRPAAKREQPARPSSPAKAPPPKIFAYIYQRPDEEVVRMAIGTSPATAREMGIFQKPETAQDLAHRKGWALAWEGVKPL